MVRETRYSIVHVDNVRAMDNLFIYIYIYMYIYIYIYIYHFKTMLITIVHNDCIKYDLFSLTYYFLVFCMSDHPLSAPYILT